MPSNGFAIAQCQKKKENHNSKGYMYPNIHWNTIYNSQDMEETEMSISRGIDKEGIHIYNGILLSHKKWWNNAICSDMDGPWDCPTEWIKSDRERQISYDITYMWNLKKKGKSKLILKTEIVSQMQKTNSWLPRGKREGDKLGDWDLHTHTATCNR